MRLKMYPLLTNINSQFIDSCGKPLSGGKVYTYEANTTTPKLTYADTNGQSPNTNPIILDESGRANIYLADGAYRIRVLDRNEALIADTNKISRYVTNTELEVFVQTVEAGLSDLSQVKESLEVFAVAAINNQKGMPDGLTPLDANTKVDPLYLPTATTEKQGIVKLNNTLTSAKDDEALTAAQGKILDGNFKGQSYGIGQSWQNVSASRSAGTAYQNTTGKVITLAITAGSASLSISMDNSSWTLLGTWAISGGGAATLTFPISNNQYYKMSANATSWSEFR